MTMASAITIISSASAPSIRRRAAASSSIAWRSISLSSMSSSSLWSSSSPSLWSSSSSGPSFSPSAFGCRVDSSPRSFPDRPRYWHRHPQPQRRYHSSSPALSSPPSSSDEDDFPPHTVFPMPALSPTMEAGSIKSWNLKEGDPFVAGDVLCTVETDKAAVDFEAQDDGVLAKILVGAAAGAEIPVGAPICVVVEEEEHAGAFRNYVAPEAGGHQPSAAAPPAEEEDDASDLAAAATSTNTRTMMMPSARHLAESSGFDASSIAGTGKGGRITKGDVLLALGGRATGGTADTTDPAVSAPPPAAPAPPPEEIASPAAAPVTTSSASPSPASSPTFEDIPNSKMRKIIASRLTESKRDVPHFYTSAEIRLDEIARLRRELASDHGVRISVNDFVIRCAALALRDVPEANGTTTTTAGTVRYSDGVDVSVAVATPSGLITPIVFGADAMGLGQINEAVRDLASRAREGKLAPHEYQGGTFSVSNLGMFGITEFAAVINPPQCSILAVGGGSKQVVPCPRTKRPIVQTSMTARLSSNRAVVDEPTAALFMSAFQNYMNEPEQLLHL